ncbi:relaxase/mobilization nuclease domain-containing protein [Brachybacterium sp. MASK1Z-5]|uniref:Relaxase/mobilization nuclease domain-containing protein n=1 Tax=Brachybacterium halotolerans TaxID=2795215 RepID=A0ABS1BD27_9MICO|nr:relaxase/mobilization nuclease domain-containing protein [Brachybacterium halotolerans]MBK0332052.1 relaxase/mobilization nuclease domain-containing protein [Brachybacterium halotolerans]
MSTINVRPSKDAVASVRYVLHGHDGKQGNRASAFAISVSGDPDAGPDEFATRALGFAQAKGRKNQLQSYVLAFHPDEFDVTDMQDMERIRDVAVKLVERMHSADYLIAVHADSAGGHGHAHILVTNHDNLTGGSLQRYTSWKNGLHQLNDDLMREEGLRVLPAPVRPKPDWELRREDFEPAGFEQILGDKIYAALEDPRSIDRGAFEKVLAEHDVTLAVTDRDGWSYRMRREDNQKLGRKKASRLSPEFTAEGAQTILDIHAQRAQKAGQDSETRGQARARAADYGDIGGLDLEAPRRRAAAHRTDGGSEGTSTVRENLGSGALEAARSRASAGPVIDHVALREHARWVEEDRLRREQAERDRADAQRARELDRRAEARRFHEVAADDHDRAEEDREFGD